MLENLVLCYMGVTIVHPKVIDRVQSFEDKARIIFGVDCRISKEKHITVIPPFYASYEDASKINLGCAVTTLLVEHPLITTVFSIKELNIMEFNGLDVLHFPVKVEGEQLKTSGFTEYVQTLRKKVNAFGCGFKDIIPEEYKPHITAFVGQNIKNKTEIQSLIKRSELHERLYFRASYPTLYAKYPKLGWRCFSQNTTLS